VSRHLSVISLLLGFLLFPAAGGPIVEVLAAESHTEFNLGREMGRRGNIFDVIFGTPPPLATERGLLLIDAFFDRNGNDRQDPGEEGLDREIFCLVDGVEYDVPAFIPGLTFRGSYKMLCAGETFSPAVEKMEFFVERHGQIFRLNIPCRRDPLLTPPPLPSAASPLRLEASD